VHESRAQCAALGLPQLDIVVIDHPLSTLSAEQICARAEQAVPQVMRIWKGESGSAPKPAGPSDSGGAA